MIPDTTFVVAIPARFGSKRLPGKPLLPIAGTPMIVHVARRALAAGASEVVVATDDKRVADALAESGVAVAMTRRDHESGTDRLAEVVEQRGWRDDTIVVNLHDEPLAPSSVIPVLRCSAARSVASTLATPFSAVEERSIRIAEIVLDHHGQRCISAARRCRGRAMHSPAIARGCPTACHS